MKVRELIEKLLKEDQDSEVVLQIDSEGNGYCPCSGIDGNTIYLPNSSWDGVVYSLAWSAGDCLLDDDEWEEMKKNNPRAVLLYPIN